MSSAPLVALLDYGSGNLHSATRAVAAAGCEAVLTTDPDLVQRADGLVVPGVGAFAACMAGLRAVGGPELIRRRLDAGRPVLGICVGHQIMFERGVEHGDETDGLGLLPGTVERLESRRLPHMGWNTVDAPGDSALFAGVADQRFYFVHSYGVRADAAQQGAGHADAAVTWAEHDGDRFIAAVEQGALSSTQFHPEKSGDAGGRLLRNWAASLRSSAGSAS